MMYSKMFASISFLLLLLSPLVYTQTYDSDSICQRYAQSSAVTTGGLIYYDGGWWSPKSTKDPADAKRATSLLLLDASKSWKISSPSLVAKEGVKVPIEHLSDNNVMFADDEGKLHQFGFSEGQPKEGYRRWFVDPKAGGEWKTEEVTMTGFGGTEASFNVPISNAGYAKGSSGFGYSVGGDAGSIHYSSSVVEYNLAKGAMTNLTGSPMELSKGALVYLPLGKTKKGVLVSLGGKAAGEVDISPKNIAVFDIDNKKWYQQVATGNAPANLVSASAVALAAQDDSSYSIYVINSSGIAALSLPSFTWHNVQPGEQNAPIYRERPSVNIAGNRQMIMYGGQGGGANGADCDTAPVHVFDTTDLSWSDSFMADADAYEVPDLITKVIGGNGKGGAKMRAPRNGWSDKKLGTLFSVVKKTTTGKDKKTKTTTDANGAQAMVTVTSEPETKDTVTMREKTLLPEWALITVSIVCGLLAVTIGLVIFLWCRRRRQWSTRRRYSGQRQLLDDDEDLTPPRELHSESAVYELSPANNSLNPAIPTRMKTVKVTEETCEIMGDIAWSKRRSVMSILSTSGVPLDPKTRKGSWASTKSSEATSPAKSKVVPPVPAFDRKAYK